MGRVFVLLAVLVGIGAWRWRTRATPRSRAAGLCASLVVLVTCVELGAVALTPRPEEEPRSRNAWEPAELDIPALGGFAVPAPLLSMAGRPSAEGPLRVLFMGDSFAAGEGVGPGEDYASGVGRRLASAGVEVEIVNHGLSGTSVWTQLAMFDHHSGPWVPDVVVWTWVLNDLGRASSHLGGARGPEDDGVVDRRVRQVGWSRAVDLFRGALAGRASSARVVAGYRAAHDPALNGVALDRMEAELGQRVRSVTDRGGRFLMVIHPLLFQLDAYPFTEAHAEVADRARRAGAEVLDLLPIYAGEDAASLHVSRRDHHPNAIGHARDADAITAALLAGELVARERPACEAVAARTADPASPVGLAALRCAAPDDPAGPLGMASLYLEYEVHPGWAPFAPDKLVVLGMAEAVALSAGTGDEARVRAEVEALGPALGRLRDAH